MSECMSRTEAAICKTSDGAAADDEDRDGSNPCNTEAQRLAGRCGKGSAADVGVTAADNKKAFGFRQGFLSSRKGRGNGAGERNRTSDLRITNALLYQLSYTGISQIVSASLRRTALNRSCAFYGDFEKSKSQTRPGKRLLVLTLYPAGQLPRVSSGAWRKTPSGEAPWRVLRASLLQASSCRQRQSWRRYRCKAQAAESTHGP